MRKLGNALCLLPLATFLLAAAVWPVGAEDAAQPRTRVPYYSPPGNLTFCGQPVPLHLPGVWERLDQEFTIVVYSHAQVYLWLKRMHRHFPEFEGALRAAGLPEDLKYVAVAESDLRYYVQSPAGAVGPWQFMPATGQRYGLRLERHLDERRDFFQSTSSALKYLETLYGMFRDWPLALAAYNCGEARVQRAMEHQGTDNYFELDLPLETERYVFRILAIKEVLGNPEKYGYHLPHGGAYENYDVQTVRIRLRNAVSVRPAAKLAGVSYKHFRELNPSLTGGVIPRGDHMLYIPRLADGEAFREGLTARAKRAAASGSYYKVRRGDTLSEIAQRFNTSVSSLRRANGLKGSTIRIGQTLRIP